MLRETRTEEIFLKNMNVLACTDPSAQWRFVTDKFNTHASESWVRYLATACRIEARLGAKGSHGNLQSLQARRYFLADKSQWIWVVNMPKYCRWSKQIMFWFGMLQRKLMRDGAFSSLTDLGDRIIRFIGYDNETMAKPCRWTCEGRILCK
jgi:hypothetical protein